MSLQEYMQVSPSAYAQQGGLGARSESVPQLYVNVYLSLSIESSEAGTIVEIDRLERMILCLVTIRS